MARLHYVKPTRAALLDQLCAQIPGLTPQNTHMEGNATDVWITVPDVIPETLVAAAVMAHDAAAIDARAADSAQSDASESRSLADADATLAAYLALAAPTNAQTAATVKLLVRIARRLLRKAG